MKKWQEAMLSLPTQPPGIPAADTPSPTVIAVMAKRQCATCEPVVKVSGALRERRYWRTVSDAAVLNADSMVELQRAALSTADAPRPAARVLDRWTAVDANGEQVGEICFSPEYAEQRARRLDVLYSANAPHRVVRVALLDAVPDARTGEGATGKAALQVDDAAVGSVVVDEAMAGMATGKAGSLRETQPEIHETLVQTVHAYMEVARIGVQQNKYGDTFLRRHTSALKTARSVQDALEALILALPAAAQPTEGAGDASL